MQDIGLSVANIARERPMKFTAKQLALMGMLIALNVAIGGIVHVVKLPIFLDAIGTILAAIVLGLIPGIVVGVVSFLLAAAIISPVYIWFIGTQAVVAAFVYVMASRLSAFKSLPRVIPTGLLLGVVAGIVSAPVIVFVFGGVAGSGRDLITAGLLSTGQQIYKAVILSGAASEPVDKLLQTLAAFFVLKSLPKRVLGQYRNPVLEKNGFL
jgi:energy-coupling factor transport system substrate-specific component